MPSLRYWATLSSLCLFLIVVCCLVAVICTAFLSCLFSPCLVLSASSFNTSSASSKCFSSICFSMVSWITLAPAGVCISVNASSLRFLRAFSVAPSSS